MLVAEELVDNGAAVYPDTYWLQRVRTGPRSHGWIARARRRFAAQFDADRVCSLVESQLRRSEANVLHIHFGTFATRLLPLLEESNLPVIVTLYGVDASAALRDPSYVAGYERLYRRADRIVVLSEIVRDRLEGAGCDSAKITVWDMPIDFEPYPFRTHQPHSPLKLLTAARFVEKKGYPVLLRAARALQDTGIPVTLTAIGYGPLRKDICREAELLGLSETFSLVDTSQHRGFTGIYAGALATHDIFVLPSTAARDGDDEGGPALTLVMAQAAGLPVVCTPFAGSERSVLDRETGLFCKPDDPRSLAETIADLLPQDDLRRDLAVAASALVRQRFDKDRQISAMEDIYRSVIR